MKLIEEVVSVHCSIPLRASKVVGMNEFQKAYKEGKNKGQRLRACLRTLSSMGYLQGMYSEKDVKDFIEDFDE